MKWLDEIDVSELPRHYQEMVRLIGIENTIKLIEHFGKMPFYFISLDGFIREKKKQYIIKNFTGNNHHELARVTGYSLAWVYEILRDQKALNKVNQKLLFQ
ncbi:MAG: hypothetical protein DWB56_14820 [Candidatus Jettenia sp.]|uniref:Mor transcription activator family protein n=1 Tax=Candidatus Jettenia sp. AMX1 TaxID=2293637 RepID=UPI00058BC74B|nr:Mor transcription activator family protein [Candidatus Jettenia sp. AMX1]KAA0243583.1 MAG: hypothetical protein EDM70_10025 [Candidatus Brocadia sp. AMX2]MBC6930205.1 hypothetical protein [Candidatus Jettenia sp.]GIL19505.1 MAG: hypothetical protein BroJett041_06190 [Candidatus Jettenia caeni]MCQ3927079.1 hypothetical protein [Candidatus Jettenia sp.]MDL1939897.1 hypothetical protein [Candidatus Jettenia sp. AMX1]